VTNGSAAGSQHSIDEADMPPMEAVQEARREILGNGRVTNFGRTSAV
jgi:hypothetical protein